VKAAGLSALVLLRRLLSKLWLETAKETLSK